MKDFEKWKNQCLSNKVFDVINITLMMLILIICFYPLYYVVMLSFSKEIVGVYFWPKEFSLSGYKLIFKERDIYVGYFNTIIYTIGAVLAGLAVTLPCAYALSRKDFRGRGFIMGYLLVTMYVSGGLIPGYLVVYNLGLLDTRTVIILGGMTSTYNVILSRTFFHSTIPEELHDAASIDGCDTAKFFVKVVLPLSKPIIAVMSLYMGVAQWNSYFTEMIYLRDENKYPLALFLRRLLFEIQAIKAMMESGGLDASDFDTFAEQLEAATSMQYCLILVSTLPVLIVYPYLQKYFAKGVMIGSVKG